MNKGLSHSDTTMTQEVLTLTLEYQRTSKLNNSKDLLNIEESVNGSCLKLTSHKTVLIQYARFETSEVYEFDYSFQYCVHQYKFFLQINIKRWT